MNLTPITSEKAVKLIDTENTLLFATERRATKTDIKQHVEQLFGVKVLKVRTSIQHNVKYAYVRLAPANPAMDIAAKLGII